MNFFQQAPADRLTDLIYRSHGGLETCCLIAGNGHSLMSNLVLADPSDLNLHVRGKRIYVAGDSLFTDVLTSQPVSFRIQPELIFEVACNYAADIPILLFARSQQSAETADQGFFKAAMLAAQRGRWSMVRAAQWLELADRVRRGGLLPSGGDALPGGLAWKLDRPVFRQGQEDILAQWKLLQDQEVGKPTPDPVLTIVTDAEGNIPRKIEQVMLRVIRGSVEGKRPRLIFLEQRAASHVSYGEPPAAVPATTSVPEPAVSAPAPAPVLAPVIPPENEEELDYPTPAKLRAILNTVVPFDASRKQRA